MGTVVPTAATHQKRWVSEDRERKFALEKQVRSPSRAHMSEALFGIFEPVLCRAVERQIHFPCFPQDEILGFVGDVRLCVVSVVDWIGLIFFFGVMIISRRRLRVSSFTHERNKLDLEQFQF